MSLVGALVVGVLILVVFLMGVFLAVGVFLVFGVVFLAFGFRIGFFFLLIENSLGLALVWMVFLVFFLSLKMFQLFESLRSIVICLVGCALTLS